MPLTREELCERGWNDPTAPESRQHFLDWATGIAREWNAIVPLDVVQDAPETWYEIRQPRNENLNFWTPSSAVVPPSREPDEEGFYDSTGEYWGDSHTYTASDTDEVMKLIDDTLSA